MNTSPHKSKVTATQSNASESATADDTRWRSVEDAAAFLGMPARVLRETIASKAHKKGGLIEARLDGVTARKLGRRWRVWLDAAWLNPHAKK